MKKMSFLAGLVLTAVFVLSAAFSQAQDSIQYQLVIRNSAGQLITNKQVSMKFSLIGGEQTFYQETMPATTDKFGNISVMVGTGKALKGAMKDVPWSTMEISLKVEADTDGGEKYAELGTVPIAAAPYAMYAATAGGNASSGSPKGDEALFEVCDRDGQPVFAVYDDGIVVYVDQNSADKAKRSGLVVTGRKATKEGETADYFAVDAEGTHIYIDDTDDNTKAKRSGFVVTGRKATKAGAADSKPFADDRSATKADGAEVFAINGSLTTIYVDDADDNAKAKRSGFVVTGRKATKEGENIIDIDAYHANLATDELSISENTVEQSETQSGEQPEPVQPKSMFTVIGGNVQMNTEVSMIGDMEKKVKADIIDEAEEPIKVGEEAVTLVSCADYLSAGNYALMAIYSEDSYVPVSKTDGVESIILFDENGFITKQHSMAAVLLVYNDKTHEICIRPLKPMHKTIEFGLMDADNSDSAPYQFMRLTAEIETDTGFPFVLGDSEHGKVTVKGELFYGESVILSAEPDPGYVFKDWGINTLTDNPRRMDIGIYYEPITAQFADPVLYVGGADNASTNNSGFYYGEPLPSIEDAVDVMARFNRPDLDWTICVVGTLNGPQKMGEAATSSTMRKEIVAQSVKLTGEYIGSGAYVGDEPKGTIDAQQGGTALLIANYTEQPVTIENMIITGGKYSQGGGLRVGDGPAQGNVIIGEGVLITGNEATGNDGAGGGVSVGGNALLTMTGGQISGNSTSETGSGGGVMLYGGATFDMQGGTIGGIENDDANSSQQGGGVFISEWATMTMSGTSCIIGNKANGDAGDGGGIYMKGNTILDMQGGQIAGNTAPANGGGIYNNGTVYMNGTAVIGLLGVNSAATESDHSNKATNGGGIFNNDALVLIGYKKPKEAAADPEPDENFTGGICYNYATDKGGGISAPGNRIDNIIKIYKGNISYNAAKTNGGGIGTWRGSYHLLSIEKSSITGNTAGGNGGGIFLYNWYYETETISETVIKDNYAKYNGGGIYYESFKMLTLNNCQITNNTAESGSGVHLHGDNYGASTLEMNNGSISGNNGSENVYVGSTESLAGCLSLSGSADVTNVTLDGGNATINIADALTSTGTIINIPDGYINRGLPLITAADGISLADCIGSFALSSELLDNGWIIDSNGKLNNPNIYVAAATTVNSDSDGTKDKPYATFDMAVEQLNNSDIDFTIHVDGELTNCMATIPASAQAKTIRLTGVNDLDENGQPQDVIYGVWNGEENPDNQGSVLSIITSTQVTISNLKITQGYAALGGGLHIAENANVIIADGTLIRNNFAAHTDGDDNTGWGGGVYVASGANLTMTGGSIAHNNSYHGGGVYNIGKFTMSGGTIAANKADTQNGKGGGVYNGGTMLMNGTAVIGDQDAKETPTAETGHQSNIAFWGGGVFDSGYLYFGYIDEHTWCSGSFTGGIFYNYATSTNYGGGLSSNSVPHINGQIANNSSPKGVGVFAGGQICFENYGAIPVGADGTSNYLRLGPSNSANINFLGYIKGRISVVPNSYRDGQQVVYNYNNIATNYGKIDVVPNGDDYYTINSDGTLAKIGAAKFVYYAGNEQKIVAARPLAQGSTIGDAPLVDDENFVGWYPLTSNGLGSEPFNGTETMGTENQTYVAVFNKTIEVSSSADYRSITAAVNAMDYYCNYTISVDGTIPGAQTIPTDINGKINSITLCGKENQNNILNGRNAPCVLAINTTVPVTIKDLTINGGKATEGDGAGVILSEGAKLTLESGAIIYGNIGYNNGAGIYAKGENIEIVMNSGSKIKENELKSQSTGSTDGAYDLGGAGIYISGAGIDDTKKLPKLTINEGAEISGNTAFNHLCGGAIYVDNAIVEIDGGKITVNQCGYMAGNIMVTGSNAVVTMTAGEISSGDANAIYFLDNLAGDNAVGGGVVLKNGAQFLMDGGKIKNNNVRPRNNGYGYGAAVMIYDATFVMTDGEIFNNAVVSDETAGEGAIKVSSEGSFQIGGDAYIYADESNLIDVGKNNIFLDEGAKVTVISQLSHAVVGTITPKTYSEGLPVLSGDKELVASECKKFAVLSQGATTGNWAVSAKGKLKPIIGTKAEPNAVGDIVFTDGSAVAYDATSFSFTAHKSEAVAVIYDATNKKGVAIKEKTSRAVWCKSEADGYDMIEGATDPDDGKKNTNAIYALSDFGKEDKDGYYPPFEYAKSYNAGGYTDWYIPAINEIVAMCDNKNIINTAISKVGGVELHSYDPSQPTLGRGYWSSTQAEHPNYVWSKSINYEQNGQIDPITTRGKSGDVCWIRCVRIFNDVEELLWDASEIGENVPSAADYPVIGISTVADLVQLATWVNNAENNTDHVLQGISFKLTNDIELDGNFNAPIGTGYDIDNSSGKSFWGIFDGNGHTISLSETINFTTQTTYPALFGNVAGTVKNLTVKNLTEGGVCTSVVSGIVGSISGIIENCESKLNIKNTSYNNPTAGICANMRGGSIINCKNSGTIESNYNYVGGILGSQGSFTAGVIESCINYASVKGKNNVGGIGGQILCGVRNCVNLGNVTATGEKIGGIAAICQYMIGYGNIGMVNCYNKGNVTGAGKVGGIIGVIDLNWRDDIVVYIVNCYNAGIVSSDAETVGGVLGVDDYEIGKCNIFNTYYLRNETVSYYGIGDTSADTDIEETNKTIKVSSFANNYESLESLLESLNDWVTEQNKTNVQYTPWKLGGDGYPVLNFEE